MRRLRSAWQNHGAKPKRVEPWHGLSPEEAYRKGVKDGRKQKELEKWEEEIRKNTLKC